MYTRNVWIIMWGTIYLASFKADCFHLLSNKGTNIIENQYYRFFTGLLVHVNCFHLIINAAALYWVLYFLDGKINEIKLMISSLVTGSLTNMIFSMLYPNSQSIGGCLLYTSLLSGGNWKRGTCLWGEAGGRNTDLCDNSHYRHGVVWIYEDAGRKEGLTGRKAGLIL